METNVFPLCIASALAKLERVNVYNVKTAVGAIAAAAAAAVHIFFFAVKMFSYLSEFYYWRSWRMCRFVDFRHCNCHRHHTLRHKLIL